MEESASTAGNGFRRAVRWAAIFNLAYLGVEFAVASVARGMGGGAGGAPRAAPTVNRLPPRRV